jgi:hypothetical protein
MKNISRNIRNLRPHFQEHRITNHREAQYI